MSIFKCDRRELLSKVYKVALTPKLLRCQYWSLTQARPDDFCKPPIADPHDGWCVEGWLITIPCPIGPSYVSISPVWMCTCPSVSIAPLLREYLLYHETVMLNQLEERHIIEKPFNASDCNTFFCHRSLLQIGMLRKLQFQNTIVKYKLCVGFKVVWFRQ